MKGKRTISDAVLAILRNECTIAGDRLTIDRQLSPEDYREVAKVIKGLGGVWSRPAQAHVFPGDVEALIAAACVDARYTDKKVALQFFATPASLAQEMQAHLRRLLGERWTGARILEPSAGRGALIAGWAAEPIEITAIEIDDEHAAALRALSYPNLTVRQGDFLSLPPTPSYEAAILNPPFAARSRHDDIAFVRNAWEWLDEGGVLVAIVSESAFINNDKTATAFRAWMQDHGIEASALPTDTFRESGTITATRLLLGMREVEGWSYSRALLQARELNDDDLARHASVSIRHEQTPCNACFCCACWQVQRERDAASATTPGADRQLRLAV